MAEIRRRIDRNGPAAGPCSSDRATPQGPAVRAEAGDGEPVARWTADPQLDVRPGTGEVRRARDREAAGMRVEPCPQREAALSRAGLHARERERVDEERSLRCRRSVCELDHGCPGMRRCGTRMREDCGHRFGGVCGAGEACELLQHRIAGERRVDRLGRFHARMVHRVAPTWKRRLRATVCQ